MSPRVLHYVSEYSRSTLAVGIEIKLFEYILQNVILFTACPIIRIFSLQESSEIQEKTKTSQNAERINK